MRFAFPIAFLLLLLPVLLRILLGWNLFGLGSLFRFRRSRSSRTIATSSAGEPANEETARDIAANVDYNVDHDAFRLSGAQGFHHLEPSRRVRWRRPVMRMLMALSYIALVTALARPQSGTAYREVEAGGRDIILALDLSGSMGGLDFKLHGKTVDRLTALKDVVKKFVEGRAGDRMGLVVFGTQVFTQCPLTLDVAMLSSFIEQLAIGMAGENTAIGDALAVSLQRLSDIKAESRVIVLVTDGSSNAGQLDPLEGARIAKKHGVKVHTVGIGTRGMVPVRTRNAIGQDIIVNSYLDFDESVLKAIAAHTGGEYFHARDMSGLLGVYQAIDKLEERKVKSSEYIAWEEQFPLLIHLAFILLLLAEALRATIFFRLP